jgi:hypothetical protein
MTVRQILPEAFYDSLSISNKLGDTLENFKREEIHLFSYFSSILFLYKKNPVTNWKYYFVIDSKGYPFSDELDEAIKRHILNGVLKKRDNFLEITSRGSNEFFRFKNMQNITMREEYIEASCATNIVLPYSKTIRSLLNDPGIKNTKSIGSRQKLNTEMVYQHFSELSKAIGVHTDDLIIPAVTWINYIAQQNSTVERE